MGDENDFSTPRLSLSPTVDVEEIKSSVQKELRANYDVIKSTIFEPELQVNANEEDTKLKKIEEENAYLKTEVSNLKILLYEKTFRAHEYEKKYRITRDQKRDLRNKLSLLEKKLATEEWPNKVRAVIFDIEGDLNVSSLLVCFQCGEIHTPQCHFSQSTAKYPSDAKAQRIFLRRQRWYHLLISVFKNPDSIDNPRIKKIVINLKNKFDRIHDVSNIEGFNESEMFIRNLTTFEELIFWFCQAVADIFEELSQILKCVGSTGEIESMGIFTPPYDLLATVLVNSCVIFDATGRVTLTPFSQVFVPKKKDT